MITFNLHIVGSFQIWWWMIHGKICYSIWQVNKSITLPIVKDCLWQPYLLGSMEQLDYKKQVVIWLPSWSTSTCMLVESKFDLAVFATIFYKQLVLKEVSFTSINLTTLYRDLHNCAIAMRVLYIVVAWFLIYRLVYWEGVGFLKHLDSRTIQSLVVEDTMLKHDMSP